MSSTTPPLPPFDSANDVDTEPGVGIIALRQENARLRRERDDARRALSNAPPPLPARVTESDTGERAIARSKAQVARLLGKWAFLLGAVPFIGAAVARKWPQYADLVDVALHAVGLR